MASINAHFNAAVWPSMTLYGLKKPASGITSGLSKKKKENEFIENYFIQNLLTSRCCIHIIFKDSHSLVKPKLKRIIYFFGFLPD